MKKDIEILNKRLKREILARKEAEAILDKKAHELFIANESLRALNENLEKQIKERLAQLEEQNESFRHLVENASEIIFKLNHLGCVLFMNPVGIKEFGYSTNEIIGKPFINFIPEEFKEELFNYYRDLHSNDKTKDYKELPILRKDTSILWIGQSVNKIINEDGNVYYTSIARDITKRIEAETKLKEAKNEAQQAQMAEQQFLATMSHEIRTPLNAIIGMSHLIRTNDLDRDQQKYLDVIVKSTDLLKNLIADVLDITKIDSGHLEPHLQHFCLRSLSEGLIHSFKYKNRSSNKQFNLTIDDTLKHWVISDSHMLNQILMNLLSNADKFTSKGEIQLVITVIHQDDSFYNIKIEVKDSGKGIESENLSKIFNKYQQANPEIRKEYGGTGLGLPISQKLVKILGGDLEVDSKIGEGSNFFFTIKMQKGNAEDFSLKGINPVSEVPVLPNSYRILVAEDNRMNRVYIETLLEQWGIEFLVAVDGYEVLKFVKKHDFDLIIMDIQMPGMDGIEATTLIREMNGSNKDIPIIALTASSFITIKEKALAAGMTDFVTKPFSPKDLIRVIKENLLHADFEEKEGTPFQFSINLDSEHLQKTYSMDLNHAYQMFGTFLEIIGPEMDDLMKAVVNADRPLIKKICHKIKPIFSMVGVPELTGAMNELESQVESLSMSELIGKFELIQKRINGFIPIIEEEKNKLRKAC